MTLGLGPIVKYSRTPADANRDRFISSFADPVYGTGSFGQVGAQARIEHDTRDRPAYPTRGVLLRGTGAFYPGVWDVTSAFGSAEGALHAYLTARVPTSPTLALRVGGKKVFGTFPFHESAFLGGPGFTGVGTSSGHVRGVRKDRFAGDASLYGNAELRLALARFQFLMPERGRGVPGGRRRPGLLDGGSGRRRPVAHRHRGRDLVRVPRAPPHRESSP